MKLAKKHIKRINDLLNSERVASHAIIDTSATDEHSMRIWVTMGWRASQALYGEYGIVAGAGSLHYWDSMKQRFAGDVA